MATTSPEDYILSHDWVNDIAPAILTFVERAAGGEAWESRTLFEGWLDVDIVPLPPQALEAYIQLPDALTAFGRGYRFLFDKIGLEERFAQAFAGGTRPTPTLPTEDEFLNAVNDFWYHTVWTAKHLRRGEIAWAKGGCDGHLKDLLRRVLVWHAQATHGVDHDTWFRGRFLEEWADPRAVKGLSAVFAYYDPADIRRALFATMALFRTFSVETAERLNFAYPHIAADRITDWVRECLSHGID
jgi:aminoglycoside 6-adenylyltransferase